MSKRVQITESELIKLIEMEVQQYQDDEGVTQKHFLSPIISIELFGGQFNDKNIYTDTDKTKLYVDWTLFFGFNLNGYKLAVKINNIPDTIIYYKYYDENGREKTDGFKFSSKGFKIEQPKYIDDEFKIDTVDIDLDKKIISCM